MTSLTSLTQGCWFCSYELHMSSFPRCCAKKTESVAHNSSLRGDETVCTSGSLLDMIGTMSVLSSLDYIRVLFILQSHWHHVDFSREYATKITSATLCLCSVVFRCD